MYFPLLCYIPGLFSWFVLILNSYEVFFIITAVGFSPLCELPQVVRKPWPGGPSLWVAIYHTLQQSLAMQLWPQSYN